MSSEPEPDRFHEEASEFRKGAICPHVRTPTGDWIYQRNCDHCLSEFIEGIVDRETTTLRSSIERKSTLIRDLETQQEQLTRDLADWKRSATEQFRQLDGS